MNKYRPLILALVCVLCAAVSFAVVKIIKSGPSDSADEVTAMAGGSSAVSAAASTGDAANEDEKKESEDEQPGMSATQEAVEKAKADDAVDAAAAKAKAEAEEKERKAAEANKMSPSEFQGLLASSTASILGGKHPQVAKSISFSFQGINEGERHPGDIVSIREKVANGIWSSFTVVSVGYDAKGKINSAVIRPNY